MARARNIKPKFFTNEDLVELDFATRLLFIGLWTEADKEGRLDDRPKRLKMALFPADSVDVDAMLKSLNARGFIRRYSVNSLKYIQIVNFNKHQNPHHTEKDSVIPPEQQGEEHYVNGEITVKEPIMDGEYLADSLIPDSLFTDSPIPDSIISCYEPIVSEPAVIEPAVIEILTNKKNELAKITHRQYDRWVETYPAVDVWQTLLRIKSWAENNPAKRKTSKGMARFIDSWLAREQDKPRLNPGGPGGAPQGQFKNSREKNAERNKEIFDYNRAIDF
jgi:hypothetical protein